MALAMGERPGDVCFSKRGRVALRSATMNTSPLRSVAARVALVAIALSIPASCKFFKKDDDAKESADAGASALTQPAVPGVPGQPPVPGVAPLAPMEGPGGQPAQPGQPVRPAQPGQKPAQPAAGGDAGAPAPGSTVPAWQIPTTLPSGMPPMPSGFPTTLPSGFPTSLPGMTPPAPSQ